MFRVVLSADEAARLIMKNFGYNDEDLKGVKVKMDGSYIQIIDENVAVGPEPLPEDHHEYLIEE